MKTVFRAFLVMLAKAGDCELARHAQFLKVENEILQSKLPKRITVTRTERRRLVKFGRGLGSAIQQLVTIVSPRTFFRWLAADDGKPTTTPAKTGRP